MISLGKTIIHALPSIGSLTLFGKKTDGVRFETLMMHDIVWLGRPLLSRQ